MDLLARLRARVRGMAGSGGIGAGEVPTAAISPLAKVQRPTPPGGARNYVVLILDSCRFDAFVEAAPKVMAKLGPIERRWSYATWTSPSHYNLLTGLLPHTSPPQVYASEYYKDDFLRFRERLGIPDMSFGKMVPELWLPTYLRDTLGYRTQGFVSMPVLNPTTGINRGFDDYALLEKHNDLRLCFDRLRFYVERPSFVLINAGETHYPYATPDEPENDWPRIHGVNGVFKHMDAPGNLTRVSEAPQFFDDDKMKQLYRRQVEAVRWVDRVVEELFDLVPENTWITITADHGELFGEEGYFGHGPIQHSKVLEVPFVEGKLR